MKRITNTLAIMALAVASLLGLGACHSLPEWNDDLYGNFDALWTIMDEHYCFFEEKGIDWEATGAKYRAQIKPDMTEKEFFGLCADMLDELRDGHTNLISWFDVSYYRKWWSDYPQNFDWRLIQQYYLDFDYSSGGGLNYKLLEPDSVGYVRYASFAAGFTEAFISDMLYSLKDCNGLVIDIRDNGGGALTNARDLAAHFVVERTLGGYISHKTGPGHNDFSEPYPYHIDPAAGVKWLKPVVVLTNRGTYSAANNFVAMVHEFDHVAVMGNNTGGGSGAPFSSEIPCGWAVRFSASPIYDAQKHLTEHGVPPTEGFDLNMDPEAAAQGHDTILDTAIETLVAYVADFKSGNKITFKQYLARQQEAKAQKKPKP